MHIAKPSHPMGTKFSSSVQKESEQKESGRKENRQNESVREVKDLKGNKYSSRSYGVSPDIVICGFIRSLNVLKDTHSHLVNTITTLCSAYLLWSDSWDEKLCGAVIKLDSTRRTASYVDNDSIGWFSVFGTNAINVSRNGRYHWSFNVRHSTGSNNAQEIHIGIAGKTDEEWKSTEFLNRLTKANSVHLAYQEPIQCSYLGRCALLSVPGGYGGKLANAIDISIAYDSSSHANRLKSPLQFANIGDTFDVFVDCKKGTVQFGCNDIVYDPVWDGLKDQKDLVYRVGLSMVEGRTVEMTHFASDYEIVNST